MQIEIFAERADQDRLPEALDGVCRLPVAMTPLQKRLAGVGLRPQRKRGDAREQSPACRFAQEWKAQKRRRGVQRRGQRRGAHAR